MDETTFNILIGREKMPKKCCWLCHWYWLEICTHNSHKRKNVYEIKNQPKDCEHFITNEEWNKTHIKPLSQERCKELLDAMIENLHVGEKTSTVIKHLLHVGFTQEELINHFHYSEEDVKDAICDIEEEDYEDTLIFTG